jgi:toxin ParE1/3/4
MILSFHKEAEQEFEAALNFYQVEAGRAISKGFLNEVVRISKLLQEYPEFGTPVSSLSASGLRRYPLKRFPYDLMYRVKGDTIRILAVAHQHRKPGYWQGRK